MRVRTLVTFVSGAAAGAGTVYLLDPEHGPERRRQALRSAGVQARRGAARAVVDVRRRVEEVAAAAVAGYRQGSRPPPGR